MADDRHHRIIRGNLGCGSLSAFGGTTIIFWLQFNCMARYLTALFDSDFDAGLGVNPKGLIGTGDDQG